MPHFVRAGLRHDRWLDTEGRAPLDLPADVLADLRTTDNALSVFEVTEIVSAERVAIALMAAPGKKEPDHTAYAVFDRADVERLGIPITKTSGDTIDAGANSSHYDLNIGSGGKLLEFAAIIAGVAIVPITKKRVAALLRAGFENGQLDHTRNPFLRAKVGAQIQTRL